MASKHVSSRGKQNQGSKRRGGGYTANSKSMPALSAHTFVFNYTLGEFEVFGEVDPVPGGAGFWTFRLSDIPQAAQWSSLFDLYKINWVEVSFCPTANQSALINSTEPPGGTNPAYYLPYIHTFVDYTNTSAPTTGVSYALNYSTYRRQRLDKQHTRRFTPRASVQASQPGTVTPTSGLLSSSAAEWYSCSQPGLRFAGIGAWCDPVSSGSVALKPFVAVVYVRISISFKNVV